MLRIFKMLHAKVYQRIDLNSKYIYVKTHASDNTLSKYTCAISEVEALKCFQRNSLKLRITTEEELCIVIHPHQDIIMHFSPSSCPTSGDTNVLTYKTCIEHVSLPEQHKITLQVCKYQLSQYTRYIKIFESETKPALLALHARYVPARGFRP